MSLGHRLPQYALVAQRLMSAIREGRYRPGSLLPPENTLCERFGVSRITVRAAMKGWRSAALSPDAPASVRGWKQGHPPSDSSILQTRSKQSRSSP
jgi:DNA-binding transcriptional MocR family regulator